MGNKMKKLLCSLLAAAMVVSSASALVFAEGEDAVADAAAETTVTETVADDASTADLTDEEKEAEDAEKSADAATEATEAPAAETTETAAEATAAPAQVTSSGTSYDNDAYYQKALALCSSLGIISGYEDGSVRPESNVTRAEMASIVLRMLATQTFSKYQNTFSDVTDAHWAADQIQTAKEASVISGFTDGTFRPDDQVTYAQVIVMLVNALNYKEDAEYYGGWQQGYIKEAGELELLKNAPGSADVASDRGTVIKMVYNALLGDYKEVRSFDEYGQPRYSTDKSLAEAKFDVIEAKGTLYGTAKTTIDEDVQDGQVEILVDKETEPTFYDTKLTGLEDYIGQKVTFYYKENSGLTSEVVAVTYDASKSEVYEITDLDTINSVTGFDQDAGQIKIEKVSKAKKTTSDVKIVYNGRVLENASSIADINDLLLPEEGSIKLVKTDKNNDDYDVMFVDSYETVVVTSATDTRLIGKIQDPAKAVGETKAITYNLDDSVDRTITVTKAGSEIRLRNLKKNDVATVRASYSAEKNPSPEVFDVVVTGESITGTASAISSKKMDNTYATINGDKYDVANVAVGDLQTGTQATFYLNQFGKIGYIEGTSGSRLAAGEKYGWIMDAYKAEGGDGYMVKLMTEQGEQHFKLANKVDYWAPKAAEGSGQVAASTLGPQLAAMLKDEDAISANFPAVWTANSAEYNTSGYAPYPTSVYSQNPNQRRQGYMSAYPTCLVKYKTNSSGNVTRLYGGVSITNYQPRFYDKDEVASWSAATKAAIEADGVSMDDFSWGYDPDSKTWNYHGITQPYLTSSQIVALKNSEALILDLTNRSGATLVSGLVAGYVITDDIPEFRIPKEVSDYSDSDNYTVGNVVASSYNQRENGLSDPWMVADADGTKPGAIMRYVTSASKPVNPADMDNVSGPTSMIVDSIDVGVDDDDNTIYVINGYLGGSKVSVTTKKTSALAELTSYENSGRDYGTASATSSIVSYGGNGTVWESGDEVTKDSYLTDYLNEGDIIITDGEHILIYASAQDVYTRLRNGENIAKTVAGSNTRNYFWFNQVTDSDFSDTPWMAIGGSTLSADAGMAFDIVEIDLSAKDAKAAVSISDDLASIADVEVYDADQDEFDYAYARFANKGSLQEVIVYRIKGADNIGVNAAE